MSTSNAAATAVNTAPSQAPVDPFDDPVTSNKMAVRALIPLLITFVLGTLCLQGFNLVFQQVGADVGAPAQARRRRRPSSPRSPASCSASCASSMDPSVTSSP